jgi:glyoxylase-like metal-dependent hydrolase (beta-lactamase superfamily II)
MSQRISGPFSIIRPLWIFFLILVFACAVSGAFAQQEHGPGELHVQHVQGRVYMLSGAGGNVTVQVGDEVLAIVDTGTAAMSDKVLNAIQGISNKPIAFIVNTSGDEDHTGGNSVISRAGSKELSGAAGDRTIDIAGQAREGAAIIAYINVLNRMIEPGGKRAAIPKADWPTDTYDTNNWKIFNDEAIVIYHVAAAHTDGDSFIFFRRSDVVSAGELFVPSRFPIIDEEKGGNIDGIIDSLTTLIDDVLVPRENEEGGTIVIPGRGRLCDRTDVTNYRDMLVIVRARIADLVKKGKTLREVEKAKPTFGYDGLYGADSGPWTTDMFIEAVYRNLTKDKNHK